MGSPDLKPKRLLTAEQQYDLWVRMLAAQSHSDFLDGR